MNTRTLALGRMSRMMVALAAIGVIALSAAVLVRPVYAADPLKGTICHANSGSKGFVVITIGESGIAFPHLDSNGSPTSGHEQDFLLSDPEATVEDCQAAANPANLTITKTPDGGTVNAGNPISFTITVSNAGPGATANAVLNDTLPAGFEWVENPDKAECTIDSNVLHCDIASLASGESFSVTVTSPTQAADCALVLNTAVADADNHVQISNAGDVTVQCATVTITKTPDGGTVNAGNPISFTITVSNAGPGAAANAVLDDTLPAGFEWVENPLKDECTIVSNALHCDIASLASGESFSVTVTSPTQAADCALVRNTAVADADNHAQISNAGDVTVQCATPEIVVLTGTGTPAPTPELVVLAGSGTPAPSVANTALSQNGVSPIPTIAFSLILLASLGALAYANVKTVRSRS